MLSENETCQAQSLPHWYQPSVEFSLKAELGGKVLLPDLSTIACIGSHGSASGL